MLSTWMRASGSSVARIRIALSKSERNRVTLVIPDTPPWQMSFAPIRIRTSSASWSAACAAWDGRSRIRAPSFASLYDSRTRRRRAGLETCVPVAHE